MLACGESYGTSVEKRAPHGMNRESTEAKRHEVSFDTHWESRLMLLEGLFKRLRRQTSLAKSVDP